MHSVIFPILLQLGFFFGLCVLTALINRFSNLTIQKNFFFAFVLSFGSFSIIVAWLFELNAYGLALIASLGCIGFITFQLINLLTTSIRLKLLNIIFHQKPNSEMLLNLYSSSTFIELRLKRLTELNQIREINGEIQLISKVFVRLSQPVYWFRRLLSLDGEQTFSNKEKSDSKALEKTQEK